MPRPRKRASPFRYFNSSPEVIRLVVVLHARFSVSLRNVDDLLFERGIDLCHETVRHWWNRFGPMFAGKIRRQRVHANFHNHFNQERRLDDRQTYKERRSAALAEWQSLMG